MIEAFTQQHADWIDELARTAGIYFFFPFRVTGERFLNPSPEIVRLFNLELAHLPGVLIFALPRADGTVQADHALFVPLEEQDFGEPRIYEPILDDLFELVREGLSKSQTPAGVLAFLRGEVAVHHQRRVQIGLSRYMKKGAQVLFIKIPKAVLDSFAEAFGKALAEKVERTGRQRRAVRAVCHGPPSDVSVHIGDGARLCA